MNMDTLAGEGTEVKGRLEESLRAATADVALQQDGIVELSQKGSSALRRYFHDVVQGQANT